MFGLHSFGAITSEAQNNQARKDKNGAELENSGENIQNSKKYKVNIAVEIKVRESQ